MFSQFDVISSAERVSGERWAASAAIMGGFCWTILPLWYFFGGAINSIGIPVQFVRSILPVVAVPLLLVGVRGFYIQYHESYSSLGRGGLRGLGFGILCLWPLGMLSFLNVYFGISFEFGSAFLVVAVAITGVLVVEVATIGVGIEAWRTNVPSRWMGIWFPALLPASILLNYWLAFETDILPHLGGHLYSGLFGLAWIGVGYHLWR